jgi:hypothetical protein
LREVVHTVAATITAMRASLVYLLLRHILQTLTQIARNDCRNMTSRLERDLLVAGERIVRVPPKLMAHVRDGPAPMAIRSDRRPGRGSRGVA